MRKKQIHHKSKQRLQLGIIGKEREKVLQEWKY